MSALPAEADIRAAFPHVGFGAKSGHPIVEGSHRVAVRSRGQPWDGDHPTTVVKVLQGARETRGTRDGEMRGYLL
jgi:hypothetical protein